MPGELFDLALEFGGRDGRGLEPRHRALDPDSVADQIIEHLRHAGYAITPIEE